MSLNYTKLYFVILAAILSAFFIILFLFSLSVRYALNDFDKRFQSFFPSRATITAPQHSPTLKRDIERLTQPQPKKELTLQEKQKKAAKENDIILCKFWTHQYKKDNLPASNLHRKTSCERAYAN